MFIQIAVCIPSNEDDSRVWALDETGGVWFLYQGHDKWGWKRVTTKRLPIESP